MTTRPDRPRFLLSELFDARESQGKRRNLSAIWKQALAETVSKTALCRQRIDPRARQTTMRLASSGRLRHDPCGAAATQGKARSATQDKPSILPLRVVNEPEFLVAAVLATTNGILSVYDRQLLGAARMMADADKKVGTVLAILPAETNGLAVAGADRVAVLPTVATTSYEPELMAGFVGQIMDSRDTRHVLMSDDVAGRDCARRLAAALGEMPAIGVHYLSATKAARRAFGNMKDLTMQPPRVMTLKVDVTETVSLERFEARLIDIEFRSVASSIEDLGLEQIDADTIALEEAPFILAAGAGIRDWPGITSLARKLNATRAGTRVVCDAGLVPRDRQVGASGRIAHADCYLAMGISGALQHLQGIEGCEKVIAINTDQYAPIIKRADLSIVGDANEILKSLQKKLEF